MVSSPSCTHEHGTSKRAYIDAKDIPYLEPLQNIEFTQKVFYQFLDLCWYPVVGIEGHLTLIGMRVDTFHSLSFLDQIL